MAGEIAVRRLSPEFWAVIGSAVTLLVALLGIAALVLTVAGWYREDIRALDAKLSGEIKALGAKVALIDKRLAVVESHVLGNRSIVEGGSLEETQAL